MADGPIEGRQFLLAAGTAVAAGPATEAPATVEAQGALLRLGGRQTRETKRSSMMSSSHRHPRRSPAAGHGGFSVGARPCSAFLRKAPHH